ncbi:hypothetical protein AMATHDRAFT_72701 [Amanita thiersii Skay4041]|uniref:MTHFR SAM-binding regulatory domain-containing protein n=1 Tax=Amanita thiersii Skay4041 TaxID=703135 RepID=A0A2A9P0S8_9AGAR|nr:hypothetical protein AMATHDRAFT_72701 [Amanita thiersii Skay4041]
MKFTEKLSASPKPFYTFEFFPPRTDQGFENLIPRIARLAALNPLAISVTWGAGGTTKDRSLDLAGLTQSAYGLDTIMHLTCTNMEEGMIDEALKNAKDRGIENIFALRGDPPRGAEEWLPIDPRFMHGTDLVKYIRSNPEYSSHFCVGVAAYPDGHPESTVEDEDTEIDYLKSKVDAGADFIITQLFYDVDRFLTWIEKVRRKGITVPIIPGIMPIQTFASFKRITKLCGTKVPAAIITTLESIGHDDQLVKDYGVSLVVEMLKRLIQVETISGVHFFTLNLEKSVQLILESLQWTVRHEQIHNKLIADISDSTDPSYTVESNLLITPITAANSAAMGLVSIPNIDGEVGRGELNNAATWDDFPNGRFGDFKSPAYGAQGLWDGPAISNSQLISQWGSVKTLSDLTNIFLSYLQGEITGTPFSQMPLSLESMTILPQLEKLTKRSWWTVGSQPAVDGVDSSDKVVGWGPRGGFVFQKSFVEFFCDKEDVDMVERKARQANGLVHWLAANNEGECRTNMPQEARNAVTWGVFPGQEIVQTTIIECESFLLWKDEAFSIWSDWASFYRPGSEERTILERVHDERWLVSIVHHDYKNPQNLWNFLSEMITNGV